MGAVRRSRAPLPRRVYWVRRGVLLALVVATVLGVVVGVARLTGGTGSDATAATDQAARSAAQTAPQAPARTYGPLQAVPQKPSQSPAAPAEPSGPCSPRDVRAVPVLDAPEAGSRVAIGIALTGTQSACTFEVSPDSLVVKVVDDEGRDFWSSQRCEDRSVVPTQEVVVRSSEPTVVDVRWNARASDRGCGDYDRWAFPGFYSALASVQGSTPEEVPFELLPVSVRYVTETPSPTPQPTPAAPATPPAG